MEYDGNGQRSYDVSVEGPLERIYAGPTNVDLTPDEPINLDINPGDLLTPNMYAEGTLHLTSEGGDVVTIDIILYTSPNRFEGIGWIDSQADIVAILLILLAMSILPSRKETHRLKSENSQEHFHESYRSEEYPF